MKKKTQKKEIHLLLQEYREVGNCIPSALDAVDILSVIEMEKDGQVVRRYIPFVAEIEKGDE
jgi:hypothetical protein